MVDDSGLFQDKIPGNIGFGITSFLLVSLFVLSTLQFSALRQGQLPTIIVALVYGVFFIIGIVASRGNIIQNDTSILEGPAAFTLGFIITSIFVGGFDFSVLSLPSESYLSSILAQASPVLTDIVNKFLASLENIVILSLPASAYYFIAKAEIFDGRPVIQLTIASLFGIVPFAVLHGVGRSIGFLVMAASIAYLWILSTAYDDVVPGEQFKYFIPVAMFSIGSHQSFNSGGISGLITFWQDLVAAASGGSIAPSAAWAIIIWQATMFLMGGYYFGLKALEVFGD
jgi:hypothetical protein